MSRVKQVDRKGVALVGDSKLEPLLRADSEGARRLEIETLVVAVAGPLVKRILSGFVRSDRLFQQEDADDLASIVMLRLISRLEAVATSAEDVVANLENYVATLTYNVTYDFLRRRFPQLTRLKNRLRYVLTHDPRLTSRSTDEGVLCGLAIWNAAASGRPGRGDLRRENATPAMLDQSNPADAVVAVLERVGQPMSLDALAELTSGLWGIHDSAPARRDVIADEQPSPLVVMETREFLQTLWREIQALRPLQRKALLLNLRDGESVNILALFVFTGIATFDEVAAATTMAPESLAAVWKDLPLEDSWIAQSMNLTRQQVINLRKSARERLARRVLGRRKRIK